MTIRHAERPAKPRRKTGGCRASQLFLMINETVYAVHPLERDSAAVGRAFRLNKPDGTLYDVAQTQHGPQCDCPDFIYRRDGLDPAGCKHVQALVAQRLIDDHTVAALPRE